MVNKNYKWFLLACLFVTIFLVQGTRQLYSAVLPQIKLEFAGLGISDAQFGSVSSFFSMTLGALVLFSGLASDFLGRKRVLVAGTLLFSCGIFLSGFAGGITSLIIFYGVLNAAGQCCVAPAGYALISSYHIKTRAIAMAILQSAVYAGVILSSLFGGKVSELGDGIWRYAFWIMGVVGIVWAVLMALGVKDEDATIKKDVYADKPSIRDAFFAMLKKPTAVLIAFAFGCFMYVRLGLFLWIIVFMIKQFGVGRADAALHGVLWINVGSLITCLGVAKIVDYIVSYRPSIRIETAALGLLLSIGPMLWIAKSGSYVSCCTALFVLGLTLGVYEAANYAAMYDCIAPRYRSVATGITGCIAFLLASPSPTILGWMGEHLSPRMGFATLALFYVVGMILLATARLFFFNRDRIKTE